MSRADCDACDEYRAKEQRDLEIYKESSDAANRIIVLQLKQIAALKEKLIEYGLEWADPSLDSLEDAREVVVQQLAREMPMIDWGEMK